MFLFNASWAVSYCSSSNVNNPLGYRLFPKGLITGAHYLKTSTSVQITGTWNSDALAIVKDGGGYIRVLFSYFDLDTNVNSPPGGVCSGYDSFYNSVNPIDGDLA